MQQISIQINTPNAQRWDDVPYTTHTIIDSSIGEIGQIIANSTKQLVRITYIPVCYTDNVTSTLVGNLSGSYFHPRNN